MLKSFPNELVEIARAQLQQGKYDFESLYALRKFMGYWNEIENVFGQEFLDGIDAITSECDFDLYPSRDKLRNLSPDEKETRERELAQYFEECSVHEIFQAIASQGTSSPLSHKGKVS